MEFRMEFRTEFRAEILAEVGHATAWQMVYGTFRALSVNVAEHRMTGCAGDEIGLACLLGRCLVESGEIED